MTKYQNRINESTVSFDMTLATFVHLNCISLFKFLFITHFFSAQVSMLHCVHAKQMLTLMLVLVTTRVLIFLETSLHAIFSSFCMTSCFRVIIQQASSMSKQRPGLQLAVPFHNNADLFLVQANYWHWIVCKYHLCKF